MSEKAVLRNIYKRIRSEAVKLDYQQSLQNQAKELLALYRSPHTVVGTYSPLPHEIVPPETEHRKAYPLYFLDHRVMEFREVRHPERELVRQSKWALTQPGTE